MVCEGSIGLGLVAGYALVGVYLSARMTRHILPLAANRYGRLSSESYNDEGRKWVRRVWFWIVGVVPAMIAAITIARMVC
jgi:hypothetical protein